MPRHLLLPGVDRLDVVQNPAEINRHETGSKDSLHVQRTGKGWTLGGSPVAPVRGCVNGMWLVAESPLGPIYFCLPLQGYLEPQGWTQFYGFDLNVMPFFPIFLGFISPGILSLLKNSPYNTTIGGSRSHMRHHDRITQAVNLHLGKLFFFLGYHEPHFPCIKFIKQLSNSIYTMCDVPFFPILPICFQCGTDQNPCHCKVVGPTLGMS